MGNQISRFRRGIDWISSLLPGREPAAEEDDEPPAKIRAVGEGVEDEGEGLEALAEAAEQAQAVPANTFVIDGELVPYDLRGEGDAAIEIECLPGVLRWFADVPTPENDTEGGGDRVGHGAAAASPVPHAAWAPPPPSCLLPKARRC